VIRTGTTRLSRREMQVVQRLARGMRLREIAEELHVGYQAVRNYVRRASKKKDLHSQAELAGLVEPPGWDEEQRLP
jgi:DNA-binding NarL/FixJ family response regulator